MVLGAVSGKLAASAVGSPKIVIASFRWMVSFPQSIRVPSSIFCCESFCSLLGWSVWSVDGFHLGLIFFSSNAARFRHSWGWEHFSWARMLLHVSHLQFIMGTCSSVNWLIIDAVSWTVLMLCLFLRHLAFFVLYSLRTEGAECTWYHIGRSILASIEGFGASTRTLKSRASFNISFRSVGRADLTVFVRHVCRIGMILDPWSRCRVREILASFLPKRG